MTGALHLKDRARVRVPMAAHVKSAGWLIAWRRQEVTGELLFLVRHDGEGVQHERNGPRDAGRMRRLFWWPEWMVRDE